MKSEFLIAVTQLAAERNLPREMVVEAVEAALASAYKRDSSAAGQDIAVRLNPNTGDIQVYLVKTVVGEVTDPVTELTPREARKEAKVLGWTREPEVGDQLQYPMQGQISGRIAAQTAKQVVIQRLREAERELVYDEFSEREGEVFTASIQRSEARYGGPVTLDLNGRAEAILPPTEQSSFERYRSGQRMKVIILEVQRTSRGPEIVVSRSHPNLLRRLFEMEVPEIYNGIVEIRAIAREAGSRSKVAVVAKQEGVDAVGACVGLRGIRIQNIVNELQGEKIDVIQWYRDPGQFISHALSPAQPLRVELDANDSAATVIVSDRSLSLAIGREGQNARLAAKLTGWKIDIKSSTEIEIERMKQAIQGQVAEREAAMATTAVEPAVPASDPVTEAASEATGEVPSEPEPIAAMFQAEIELAPSGTEETTEEEPSGEPRAADQPPPGLSAEEELLLQTLDVGARPPREEVVEVIEEVMAEDADIWKIPEPIGGGPQIRFAEDIMGAPQSRRGGGRRRKAGRNKGGGEGRAAEEIESES